MKIPFFLPECAKSLSSATGELGTGSGEHSNFSKGPFQGVNPWARGTCPCGEVGLFSYITANACLFLLYSSVLRTAFLLLLLISATWLLGLMAVNSDVMTFHYLFAIFSCLQVSWMASCPWQTLVSTLLHPKNHLNMSQLKENRDVKYDFCSLFSKRGFFSAKP